MWNNVRNKIEDREPFAEGDGGYLYMEKDGKVRKVFKSKFAFEGESNVYKKTDGIPNVVKVYKILKRNMHIIMEFVPHNLENLIIGKEPDFDKFDKNKYVDLVKKKLNFFSNNLFKPSVNTEIYDEYIDPVFLIGFPRSGTTLLDTILRSHKSINVIEEQSLVDNLINDLTQFLNNYCTQWTGINDLMLGNWWININGKNNYNAEHDHQNAILSAVYYVEVLANNTGDLVLHREDSSRYYLGKYKNNKGYL